MNGLGHFNWGRSQRGAVRAELCGWNLDLLLIQEPEFADLQAMCTSSLFTQSFPE